MSRLVAALACLAALGALGAAPASAEFGIQAFEPRVEAEAEGAPYRQAGGHPYAITTRLEWTNHPDPDPFGNGFQVPDADLKDTHVQLPAGLVGNPRIGARCTAAQLVPGTGFTTASECPVASQVGVVDVRFSVRGVYGGGAYPLFAMEPPAGVAARYGFKALSFGVYVDATLDPETYSISIGSQATPEALRVISATFTFWGVPADGSHDFQRCTHSNFGFRIDEGCGGAEGPGAAELSSDAPRAPQLTMPTSCPPKGGAEQWRIRTSSWQEPTVFRSATATTPGTEGCEHVPFTPRFSSQPTTGSAASASGLDLSLRFPQDGLLNPDGLAQSHLKKAVVKLPEGMQINPSQAEGLGVCGPAEYEAVSVGDEGCPSTAKIGTVQVKTPLLEETIPGNVYVAEPYENPSHSLIALYIVLREPERGIAIKLAGEVSPDPDTGRIVTTFDELPQQPFESFQFKFREGARAPLITPRSCGSYATKADFYPWARPDDPVHTTSSFEVTSGSGGGACPSGAPFDPGFEAGTLNNQAGSYSPFLMRLKRSDGEQDMGKFSFTLPPGVVPKLAGVGYCSDAQIAGARSRQGPHGGQAEIDRPSCPASTQIGTTLAAAGVGSQLTYVPGSLYLAGPYHGDPISAVAIVPAVAGPFDAGVVVVREALRLNPVTHVGEVDGSASDPIPHILKGIPLNVREVRVSAERPGGFTLNPTSCDPFQALSTIWGDGTASEPLAPHPVDLSSRFQAAGCAALGFKPRLGLRLKGGTRRGAFPALHAVYTPRPRGDANLSRLALTFPNSEFIEQGHFRTICTRVQFAAGAGFGSQCPKGSIYGHVKVWTPLLDEPLEGPVYLRSSNHNLPDAVFALHGLVDIELATRIDSTHGRLRAIVANSPDAPVSRAVVNMQGGQKGLFVNSTNLCAGKHRARVNAGGQNGKRDVSKPLLRAVACKKHRVKRHGRHQEKRAHRRSRR